METIKLPADVRIDLNNLANDIKTIRTSFELMMQANDRAQRLNMVSEERHDEMNLRFRRQTSTVQDIENMIEKLQDIKDSVENIWN